MNTDRSVRDEGYEESEVPDKPAQNVIDAEFRRIWSENQHRVRAFFNRRLHPRSLHARLDADDFLQDVMLRIYTSLENHLAAKMHLTREVEAAWIGKICVHLLYNHWRSGNSSIKTVQIPDLETGFDIPDMQTVGPEDSSASKEMAEKLSAAISTLPPGQREILELWMKGLSYLEICEETAKELQNVRATVHRAREKVVNILRSEVLKAPSK